MDKNNFYYSKCDFNHHYAARLKKISVKDFHKVLVAIGMVSGIITSN